MYEMLVPFIVAVAAVAYAFKIQKDGKQSKAELDAKLAEMQSKADDTEKELRLAIDKLNNDVSVLRARLDAVTAAGGSSHSPAKSATTAPQGPVKWYLSKPDASECFTRASSSFELGNSLYELTTADGINGTFVVTGDANAQQFALMMPTENLVRACVGKDIQISAGASRIVTDRPGSARFENGRWRIVQKAEIHYVK